jgi:hypothetical protein
LSEACFIDIGQFDFTALRLRPQRGDVALSLSKGFGVALFSSCGDCASRRSHGV